MKRGKIYRNNQYEYISLQEMANMIDFEPPQGWFDFINEEVNKALNIKNMEDYNNYINEFPYLLSRMKPINYTGMSNLYRNLSESKYNDILEDDILRYISYLYAFDFFDIINYPLNEDKPNLDDWFSSTNPFGFNLNDEEIKYSYSIDDLIPLQNGMNSIRRYLLKASKRIF